MKIRKCALCGGKLNENGICAECGYDNIATLKNSRKPEPVLSSGYIILLISALIFTVISAGIIYTATRNSGDYRYQQIIGPGIYQTGSYLPEGKYHIQLEKGESASLQVYQFLNNKFYHTTTYILDSSNQSKKNSFFFNEGYYFVISPGTEIGFYSDDVNKHSLRRTETGHDESYTINAPAIAGKDFPAGVYDLIYTSADGQGITIDCTVLNPDNGEEITVCTVKFDGSGDEQIFTGVPLPQGSRLTFSRAEHEITLRSAEYTFLEFYDLTWGYSEK